MGKRERAEVWSLGRARVEGEEEAEEEEAASGKTVKCVLRNLAPLYWCFFAQKEIMKSKYPVSILRGLDCFLRNMLENMC